MARSWITQGARGIVICGLLPSPLLALAARSIPASPESVAVLGDDLASGAGSSPLLKYDADLLWDLFKRENLSTPTVPEEIAAFVSGQALTPPQTLWMTEREYSGSFAWVFKHVLASFSKVYLNTEEYSWGYLAAKALGVASQNIYVAAENGARIDTLSRQIDRLLLGRDGQLPEKIFILFSLNDICAAHPDYMTSAQDYRASLTRGLQYLLRHGKAAPQGSSIYVLGPLGVTQLLTKASILQKPLEAHGESTTCGELRSRSYQASKPAAMMRHMESLYFQHILPPNPARLCPSMFSREFIAQNELGFFASLNKNSRLKKISSLASEMVSTLAGRIRSYRSGTAAALSETQAWLEKEKIPGKFSLQYVGETDSIELEGDDIADDCFHLNWRGQLKIARVLSKHIQGK